jgi:hypothetical protein
MTYAELAARARKWWVGGLALTVLAEVGVCVVLFLPQSSQLSHLSSQRADLEAEFTAANKTSRFFEEIQANIEKTKTTLAEFKVISDRSPQDVVMEAVRKANPADKVAIVHLRLSRPAGKGSPVPDDDAWELKCRGGLRDLIAFLHEVEKEGVLMDCKGFHAEATEEGPLNLTVVLRSMAARSEAKAAQERAAAEKAAPKKPAGVKTETQQ